MAEIRDLPRQKYPTDHVGLRFSALFAFLSSRLDVSQHFVHLSATIAATSVRSASHGLLTSYILDGHEEQNLGGHGLARLSDGLLDELLVLVDTQLRGRVCCSCCRVCCSCWFVTALWFPLGRPDECGHDC